MVGDGGAIGEEKRRGMMARGVKWAWGGVEVGVLCARACGVVGNL